MELKTAFRDMLEPLEFDYFGTFTQRHHMTEKMARRYAETLYERVTVQGGSGGHFFWAAEQHKQGSYHIHALMSTNMTKAGIHKEWNRISRSRQEKEDGSNNYCRVLAYDRALGGHGYVGKYVVKSLVDWDIRYFNPQGQLPLNFGTNFVK